MNKMNKMNKKIKKIFQYFNSIFKNWGFLLLNGRNKILKEIVFMIIQMQYLLKIQKLIDKIKAIL